MQNLLFFLQDESGATAIEYGLIAALVSIGTISALHVLGDTLGEIFTDVSSLMDSTH